MNRLEDRRTPNPPSCRYKFRYKFRIDVDDTVFKNLRLVGRYFELSGEHAVAASVAIDLQGMIGEGHVGFARDELGCMFDSVCTT